MVSDSNAFATSFLEFCKLCLSLIEEILSTSSINIRNRWMSRRVMECERSRFPCQLLTPCALLSQETAHALEAAAKITTEKNELELNEVALLPFKVKRLEEELSTLSRSVSYRSQVLQTYIAFRKSSEEVWRNVDLQQDGLCLSFCFLYRNSTQVESLCSCQCLYLYPLLFMVPS